MKNNQPEEAVAVEAKAYGFIKKVNRLIDQMTKDAKPEELGYYEVLKVCFGGCLTLEVMESVWTSSFGINAASVRKLYDAVLVETEDPDGREAYVRHCEDLYRERKSGD